MNTLEILEGTKEKLVERIKTNSHHSNQLISVCYDRRNWRAAEILFDLFVKTTGNPENKELDVYTSLFDTNQERLYWLTKQIEELKK